ncbi:hypothetical protein I302_106758 [Kwoniella bestiolae CBS 10118]|uniref:Uncharacterized protein n=1 Tax=Kwoniella bestiolae CBS 10118 TaxID=1296100 RepID=A0A1B9G0I1_9TREE|nr:hypothetical protein I302_05976 [Kwoniella bestiolae CBS 10118]OCF24516.1 hypothetical protein I302_05976 [Kwoniella bestiolae CBS 10118]
MLDLTALRELISQGDHVIRIHDDTSLTKLNGDNEFVKMDYDDYGPGEAWFDRWCDLDAESKADGVCAHVTGRWGRGPGREYFVDDPWISTTSDLDWAIWEIARRLSRHEPVNEVKMSIIEKEGFWDLEHPYYRDCRDLHYNMHVPSFLQDAFDSDTCAVSQRAFLLAGQSYEVLYFGKIRAEQVLRTYTFTPNYLPCRLLPEWLGYGKTRAFSWLNNLIWDPHSTSFRLAEGLIMDKRSRLSC